MENTTVSQPGTVALEPSSTVLNPETVIQPSGGGTPSLTEPQAQDGKRQSIEDVLEAESKRLKDADAEAEKAAKDKADAAAKDAKAKVDEAEKSEKGVKKQEEDPVKARGEDGKPAKSEQDAAEAKNDKGTTDKDVSERGADERQSEGRKNAEPPARFLPEARDKWGPTPFAVKAEVHRVMQEMEAETEKYKSAHERYETIRQFDDMARSNGRELSDSLAKVVQIEQAIARNPIAGLEAVLREIGPRRADGSPLTLLDVANHIVRNPQAYQQSVQQMAVPQPQAQPNRDIEALRAEIQSMKAEQTIVPLIARFAETHPDYRDLEPKIGEILGSGVIERLYGTGLSPEQKLAEAYRMVGGRAAPSHPDPGDLPANSQSQPAKQSKPDAGNKSIRGAPSDGADPATEATETDIREMLRKEMRKLSA